MYKNIGIVGAGGWGTALACLYAEGATKLRLWGHNPEIVEEIRTRHTNETYLKGIRIPEDVLVTNKLEDLQDCSLILIVTPSRALREICSRLARLEMDSRAVWVSCTKGIEHNSGLLMTQIMEEVLGTRRVAVLSGPNLAIEVANKIPAASVVGCAEDEILDVLSTTLNRPGFRVYRSDDVIGIQLGGALKNIFAIGAGCSDGFKMGDNAKAGLVTRSLTEMTRLGVALGGRRETFSGLSGIGDLMVTCFSKHSRNRKVGERLGGGESREEIESSMKMVAEGIPTVQSAYQCARRLGVDAPITEQIFKILYENKAPKNAMKELLLRTPKPEHDEGLSDSVGNEEALA
ncbi:MAG: NAD(P)H-dependent glycerol-3-phosphate dehydrogenase [Chthoniobacterales bacterium]